MWFLTHSTSGEAIYIKKAKTTIGRKGTDVELAGDDSISRNHAILIVNSKGVLTVQDSGSKYGTFIISGGASQNVPAEAVPLADGTGLKFGKLQNEWTVHRAVFKTITSMMVQEQKNKLERVLNSLEVAVADKFDDTCTHLTMPSNTEVSHKLLQALSSCISIVTPKYWIAFQESVTKNQKLPKCLDYTPRIKEEAFITPDTVSLITNPERRQLFARKSFVFISSSQLKAFEGIITSAGGKAGIPKTLGMTSRDVVARNVIVIQPRESNTQSQNEGVVNKIDSSLIAKGRRMIADTEIGLALLHCSIERWCNPEYQAAALFEPTQSTHLKITKSKVLVPGTEHSESLNVEMPSTSRKSPRKKTNDVVDTIDLDCDEETVAGNKENIPAVVDTQANTENVSLPETQADERMESIETTPEEVSNIPDTIHSDVSSVPGHEDSSNDSGSFQTRRYTRRSATTSDSAFQSAVSKVSSQSSNASSLFNFSEISAASKRTQRKRKNTDNEEDAPQPSISAAAKISTKPAKEQPITKKNKRNQTQVDSDEESMPLPQTKSSRKRPAIDSEGGLFAFTTKFAKKARPTENDDEPQSSGVSGIMPLIKPHALSPVLIRKSTDGHLADLTEGVWLSKRMLSMQLLDAADGIKSELQITPIKIERIKMETNESQDIKPSQLDTLFSVLESTLTSSTTMVSKRKQFVKKLNFKQQDKIVTTKSVQVEDTFAPLDDF